MIFFFWAGKHKAKPVLFSFAPNTLFMDAWWHKTLPQNRLETMRRWTLDSSWCFKRGLAQQVKPRQPQSARQESADAQCRRCPISKLRTSDSLGPSGRKLFESPWQPAAESPQSRRANSKWRLWFSSGRGHKLMFDVRGRSEGCWGKGEGGACLPIRRECRISRLTLSLWALRALSHNSSPAVISSSSFAPSPLSLYSFLFFPSPYGSTPVSCRRNWPKTHEGAKNNPTPKEANLPRTSTSSARLHAGSGL